MDSLLAIGVGLVLRIVVDFTTDNDNKVGGVLVGLWEGVVLNHFVRRMPRSFDPYLGFGFRIFVDFLFTQSISRLALVALWALVGMLLADVAPNVWRDSGLRHLYRQVHKDVRRVKRFVPRIRIKNDLPSVRLFSRTRSTSSEVSGSIRSDRALPSRSAAPSPAPASGPSRRPGRSPPGTLPDTSGWSETNTDVSNIRTRVVTDPGPSPALIPSREHEVYERIDTTHVTASQMQTTTIQDTTIMITQTQSESVLLETTIEATAPGSAAVALVEPVDDPSRHDPPVIPDDWVDVSYPTPAQPNELVVPQPDSHPLSQPQDGLSSLTQSRPASILVPTPPIDILPNIPDAEVTKASRFPEEVPLPNIRAASVTGGMYGPAEPRNTIRARVGEATSEVGTNPIISLAPVTEAQVSKAPKEISPPNICAASVIGGMYDPAEPRRAIRARVGKAESEVGTNSVMSLAPVTEAQVSKVPEIPPPNICAASVIDGMCDLAEPRSAIRARVGEATSEVGANPTISLAPVTETQVSKVPKEILPPNIRAASVIDGMCDLAEPRSTIRARVGEATSEVGTNSVMSLAPVTEAQISKVPEDTPLPESRAASVIGGIYDQPEPRSTLRDSFRARVGKATSELAVDSARSLAPVIEMQTSNVQSSSRGLSSWARSKLSQPISVTAPELPPKEVRGVPVKPAKSDLGSTAPGPEPQVYTPAQVDHPPSILTRSGDAPPLLFASETKAVQQQQEQPPPPKSDPEEPPASAGVDQSPAPPPQGEAEKGDKAMPSNASLLDLPIRTRTPPPPYTGEGPARKDPLTRDAGPAVTQPVDVLDSVVPGEGPAGEDPFTQDVVPAELTDEQKAIEEKRRAFLLIQIQELEGFHVALQKKLDKEDDPEGSPANAIESDMEDAGKTLALIKTRLEKQKFSDPPINPPIKEVILTDQSASEVQFVITNAILEELLARNDAGPITIQAFINKSKPLKQKAKAAKDAVMAFAKRHKFTARNEFATPGIINITF